MFVFGENPSVPPKKELEFHKVSNKTDYKLYIFRKGILFYKCLHVTIKQQCFKNKIKKKNLLFTMTPKPQGLWINLIKDRQESTEIETAKTDEDIL